MYLRTFGLQEKPFHITPNPRFIFLSKNHKEAFAHLLYGVQQRVGFLSLIGEVGTGKTTVLRTLLRQLEQSHHQVALIFNPCLSAVELLQAIHREFGISYREGDDNLTRLHDSLNRFLLEQRKNGKTVVLVIDEAQNLAPAVLEQLRLLSNLETETDKLLQLIIVGQPELEDVLNRHELRQLKQRLTVRYRLKNMDSEDTSAYIQHRLKVAGFAGGRLFSEKAEQLIYRSTEGLPRLINILCDRSLLVAYTNEQNVVDHKSVREAQAELSGAEPLKRAPWLRLCFLLSVCAVLIGVLLWPTIKSGFYNDEPVAAEGQNRVKIPIIEVQESTVTAAITEKPSINQELLAEIISKINTSGEAETGRNASTSILELWGKPELKQFDSEKYRPIEAALRGQGLSTIRFDGSRQSLLEINTPAILSIVLPNMQGKRYLAILQKKADSLLTEPPLTESGWLPSEYLDEIWFGKAVIPWNNFEQLPYLDSPGAKARGINRIQELLSLAGYPALKVTGVYDSDTISAVSDLQKKSGLAPDGRIGAQTLLQIYRLVGLDMPLLSAEVTP